MSGAGPWRGRQYHYLSSESHVHPFLVELWDEVREATGGRLDITVHSANEGLTRTHLGIIQQLIDGEIEFYLSTGGLLSALTPATTVYDLPFVFANTAQALSVFDGALGDHLREELEDHGVVALPFGLLESGFRHITTTDRPVNAVEDMAGLRIRVAETPVIQEAFRALGAEPVSVHVLDLYRALADGHIDAQENALTIIEVLSLHKVSRNVSLTAHTWSGINLLSGRKFWRGLPEDVREAVVKSVKRHVARQRAHTEALNREVESRLGGLGMSMHEPAREGFRARLAATGFYAPWEKIIGRKAWALLEEGVGPIA